MRLHRHLKIRLIITTCFHANKVIVENVCLHFQNLLVKEFEGTVVAVVDDHLLHFSGQKHGAILGGQSDRAIRSHDLERFKRMLHELTFDGLHELLLFLFPLLLMLDTFGYHLGEAISLSNFL